MLLSCQFLNRSTTLFYYLNSTTLLYYLTLLPQVGVNQGGWRSFFCPEREPPHDLRTGLFRFRCGAGFGL